MSATPLSNKKPLPPSKYVCLSEWWLAKPQLQCQGLAVGGVAYGRREKVFLSTVIAKRYEANVLETEDGITVQLRGMINSTRTSGNGFPSKVCEDFLLGFPDDWKKYTTHNFVDKCVDEVTGFGGSNARSPKSGDMMNNGKNGVSDECVNRVTGFGDSNACSAKSGDKMNNGENGVSDECVNRITRFGDSNACSAKSGDKMNSGKNGVSDECVDGITRFGDSNACLRKSGNMMKNGKNGVSDIAVACQAGNLKNGKPLMGLNDPNPCTSLDGKSTFGSPISTKKVRKDQSSSDDKEKQHSNKDAGKTCSRTVTRRVLKRSLTLLGEEKVTSSSVGRSTSRSTHTSLLREEEMVTPIRFGPVRRSPRLYNCRKSLYESP